MQVVSKIAKLSLLHVVSMSFEKRGCFAMFCVLVDLTCSGHEWGDFNCVDFSLSRHPWRTCAVHCGRESQKGDEATNGQGQRSLGLDPAYFSESDKTRIACWIPQVCVEDCFYGSI